MSIYLTKQNTISVCSPSFFSMYTTFPSAKHPSTCEKGEPNAPCLEGCAQRQHQFQSVGENRPQYQNLTQ